jgi:prepilin-type N-terminal cleavage/methylation domain-containing protein
MVSQGSNRSKECGYVGIKSETGFSLVEMLITIAIVLIAAGIAVMNVIPAVRAAHMEDAYQMTLMQLRLARQIAIDKRTVCIVTFAAPGQISLTQAFADGTPVVTNTLQLPQDVSFTAVPGLPSTPATTPDGIGTGKAAIDFDQIAGGGGNTIFFQPDGSAVDGAGLVNDGIIYLAQGGQVSSSRAVTLLGTTGRVRGWRLAGKTAGGVVWQ